MLAQDSQRDERIDELAEEFAARYRRGERPSVQEYIARHPDLADDIRDLLPALAEVEQVKADLGTAVENGPATTLSLQQIGDFRIIREVGKGGMGVVYEAEQVSLARHVALKVLAKKQLPDRKAKQRFEREAKTAAKLHHTNIVPVFGVGDHDDTPYFVMQFIPGLGLDDVLDELKRIQGKGEPRTPCPGAADKNATAAASKVACGLLTGVFRPGEEVSNRDETIPHRDLGPAPDDAPRSSSDASLPGQSGAFGSAQAKACNYWQSVARIGIQVAQALDYAHQQGILHRDIKPSNLLLDARGTVWVTDFGLAKVDDQQNLTDTGDIMGTLRYMPPEAFDGKTDARSDLYALGLTLYELLALKPAFGENERRKLIKEVTTAEPARLDKLNPAIPRDLATMIHKAIERDPAHRYQTAGELAADLQRFLDDEPIRARRVTVRERAWRWCRRNPAVAGLLAAVFLLLVAVAGVTSVAAIHFDAARVQEEKLRHDAETALEREAQERHEAESARADAERAEKNEAEQRRQAETARGEAERHHKLAEANFRQAREAVDDYLTRVSESRLLSVPGMQPLRKELLESALEYYQQFLKQRGQEPGLRKELAAAYLRMAKITAEIGSPSEALALCDKAREVLLELAHQNPGSDEMRLNLVASHQLAGALHSRLGKLDAALRSCKEAYRIMLEISPQGPTKWARVKRISGAGGAPVPIHAAADPEILIRFFSVLNDMGSVYGEMGELGAALYWNDQALLIQQSLVRQHPGHPRFIAFEHGLAGQWERQGRLQRELGMFTEARACHKEARTILESLLRDQPRHERAADFQRDLAASLENEADLLARSGQPDAAWPVYEAALSLRRRLFRANPAVSDLQSDLAQTFFQMGLLKLELNDPAEALLSLRQAIERQRKLVEAMPEIKPYARGLSRQLGWHGAVLRQMGKPAAAKAAYQEARTLLENLPPANATDFYELARWRAAADPNAGPALAALRQALDAGYRDLDSLEKDAELAPLRSRPEFRKLLAAARAKLKTLPWVDDFDAARLQAAKEGKDLFVWFGGSDWAPLDPIARKTRFERARFIDYAAKHFVMVDLDSPKYKPVPKNIAKTKELMLRWHIKGYPNGVLADAQGRLYERVNLDRTGMQTLEDLLKEVETKRQLRVRRDDLLAQAAGCEGLDKARLLDRALSVLPSWSMLEYAGLVMEIGDLDRDNKAGLRGKYRPYLITTFLILGDGDWRADRPAAAIANWQRCAELLADALKTDKSNKVWKNQWADLHRRIGNAHGQAGAWDKAETAFDAAFEFYPGYDNGYVWFARAALAMHFGKKERYRQLCREYAQLPSNTTHRHWITRLNMLAPGAFDDPALAVHAGTQAFAAHRYPWYQFALGAAHYRAGEYQEAERLILESIEGKSPAYLSHRWFWLAMACQRQGKTEEAKQWLQKGVKWMDAGNHAQPPAGGPDNAKWDQALELRLLRRQAEMVVADKAAPR